MQLKETNAPAEKSEASEHTYAAIMAGGVGSRFWPASREAHPKQFLDILGLGKSLLQMTYERFLRLCPAEHIFVATNAAYAGLVREQLPQLSPNQIIAEPSRNNTAPCVAYTAFKLEALDPQANLVIAPSDHLIMDEVEFLRNLRVALAFTAREDALLTLGIRPTRPDTGYGYIRYDARSVRDGVHPVLRFVEKPPLAQAQAMLEAGDYLWNAGIFVWRAAAALQAFQRHAPEIHRILGAGSGRYNTDDEQPFIDETYPLTPSISVDYAIMEKADNVFTVPARFGWSDLGTWASLHAATPRDESDNAANSDLLLASETENCLIRLPPDKLLVVKGLCDFIIIDEADVLLIWPKSREQDIRALSDQLRNRFGERFA